MADTDKREIILARLKDIVGGLPGMKKGFRNEVDIPESDRPCGLVLDGDETVEDEAPDGRGHPRVKLPIIVTMTPELFILTGGTGEAVGTNLNALRIQLIKAVLTDETLLSASKDGDITYLGFSTGFAAGRSIEGEAGQSFRIRYVIQPSKL
jgi:hypothetical protein